MILDKWHLTKGIKCPYGKALLPEMATATPVIAAPEISERKSSSGKAARMGFKYSHFAQLSLHSELAKSATSKSQTEDVAMTTAKRTTRWPRRRTVAKALWLGGIETAVLYVLVMKIVVPTINTLLPSHPTFGTGQLLINAAASILMVIGIMLPLSWILIRAEHLFKRLWP